MTLPESTHATHSRFLRAKLPMALTAALLELAGGGSVLAQSAQSPATPASAPVPAATASAPGSGAPAKAVAAPAVDANELQTVVVTAQKRTQTAKDIPFSLSVISGTDIEDRHIQNVEDIARAVPGVSFGAGANTGMDVITMRGVSSQGGGATVGIFLNDISVVTQNSFNQSYSGATQPKLFDIARVEVLRGPQGTLYGASSMGGALRYVTNTPDVDNFSSMARTDASHTQHGGVNYELTGVVNTPLQPGFSAIRVAIDYERQSGYIDRYKYVSPTQAAVLAGLDDSKSGDLLQRGTNSEETFAANITAEFNLGQGFILSPGLFAQQIKAGDTSIYYEKLGTYNQDKLVPEKSTDTMAVPSLNIRKDLGWADFTGLASYFYRKNNHTTDGTYFSSDFIQFLADTAPDTGPCQCGVAFWNLPGPSVTHQTTGTSSLELRLASKLPKESGVPYSWLGGVFISDRKIKVVDNEYVTGIRSTFLDLYHVAPENTSFADAFPDDSVGYGYSKDNLREYAIFGESTYYLTPALKFTGGLRISRDRTAFTVDQGGYFSQGVPAHTDLSNSYSAVTPKVAVSYDASKEVTVYANATKGNRVGGYIYPINTQTGLCAASLAEFGINDYKLSYGPDSLWSYEAGAKTNWFSNRLAVNASIYYIDWKSVQQNFSLSCGAEYTANFGNARSIGGELEVVGKPMRGLTLSASVGTTDAKLTSVVPNVGAVAGQKLLNTPTWTASTSVDYAWMIRDTYSAFARADFSWTGKSYGSYDTESVLYQRPAYGILNGSIGASRKGILVSLYVKNALNDQKVIQQVPIELVNSAYVPRPRTIGVNASMDF